MIFTRGAALRLAVPGLILAAVLAFIAKATAEAVSEGLAGLPKLPISPVLCAVLIGMLWRNALGVPRWAEEGLTVAMTTVLRIGIALVGLKLTLSGAEAIAATALPVVVVCIAVALSTAFLLTRLFGIPPRLGALLAVGTAVCGCTAVIAVSPVIRARNAETAFAITCVVLFGCIAMLCYPLLAAVLFQSSPLHAGVFLGTAIHDTSQVIGSALIYSQQMNAPDALAAASVTKLLRNLSIAVLIPAAAWWGRRLDQTEGVAPEIAPQVRLMPFFVVAFMLFILVRTVGDLTFPGDSWTQLMKVAQTLSEMFLICGMAAVGLSVSLPQMWNIGWRPLLAGLMLALIVGSCSLSLTLLLLHWAPGA
jgi:uncharacterized integral membrane protein (TIGR00698 family)